MTLSLSLPRGPLMIDVAGLSLDDAERVRLSHPLVGGVILFRRNFRDIEQLKALTAQIRAVRTPELLIAVDHEGGRVQRFLEGFTRLPSMRSLGQQWLAQPAAALDLAQTVGYVLAAELRACGIDLSFTPVLDLDWERCAVIGNRSFGRDPAAVSELAAALQTGLRRGGMPTCGKHFPGHGWVEGDSHHVIPRDERPLPALERDDLLPFARMIAAGLDSVMPAHVVYPAVDERAAGFSAVWLRDILRARLGFDGVIFSDDLCMEGASAAGSVLDRARAAFDAGCDMALVCNRPDLADQVLSGFVWKGNAELERRLRRMEGQGSQSAWEETLRGTAFAAEQARVTALAQAPDVMVGPAVGE
ncbi:beta-N-acetylhexosaminidase [Paludibacterium yongneupense]|uniref:beta-N-acetylhexosaminidase n=1 Tax=Paludibacterium yongneupense TaxID=400061 RepID=UPI00040059DF|nr:beta-N-acetylhexosaminidase [Paludibacterium yongneupense]